MPKSIIADVIAMDPNHFCRNNRLADINPAPPPPLTPAQIARKAVLEAELAYSCARSDIGSFCVGQVQDGKQWFDTKIPRLTRKQFERYMQEDVNRAVEYLKLRGLIEFHPRMPWVHVKEA